MVTPDRPSITLERWLTTVISTLISAVVARYRDQRGDVFVAISRLKGLLVDAGVEVGQLAVDPGIAGRALPAADDTGPNAKRREGGGMDTKRRMI